MNRFVERNTIRLPRFNRSADHQNIRGLGPEFSLWEVPSIRGQSLRKPVLQLARYFQLEMATDFVPYSTEQHSDKNTAFLIGFKSDENLQFGIGALFFRWQEWSDVPAGYSLEWVWVHPFFRHRGLLSKAWPKFVERFGEFHVSPPYSPSMKEFLNKIGYFAKPAEKMCPRENEPHST